MNSKSVEATAAAGNHGRNWIHFFEWTAVFLILAMIGATAFRHSSHKPLWYDEVFTMIVAQQPDWQHMRQAMIADANPPLLALSVRAFKVICKPDVAARVPSILGFLFCSLGVYLFVRRRTGVIAALVALAMLICQPGWEYAYEARPYALLLAFTMGALLCWQSAASRNHHRTWWLVGLSFFLAGAMLSHQIGIIEVLFPIGLGESIRTWQNKRADWVLWLTALAALPVLLFTFPLAQAMKRSLLTDSASNSHPVLTVLPRIHGWISNANLSFPYIENKFSLGIAAAVLLLMYICRSRISQHQMSQQRALHEWGAAIGLVALIPVTLLFMEITNDYYNCRYGIGIIVGIAILTGFATQALMQIRREVGIVLLLVLLVFFVVRGRQDIQIRGIKAVMPYPTEFNGVPIVIADVFQFVPIWWASDVEHRKQIYYLFDIEATLHVDPVPERALLLENGLIDARLDPYTKFIAEHDHFLLQIPPKYHEDAFKNRLLRDGFVLSPISPMMFEARRPG